MSYTVTPNISYGPNGEEIVSYDDAFVENTGYRQQIREAFNRDNSFDDSLYYERPDGSIGHRYADLDSDIYETFEQDYVQEVDEDDYLRDVQYIGPEDFVALTDLVGGESQYSEMMEWAGRNTNPEFIDWYDRTMNSGDLAAIEEAITDLYQDWSVRRYQDDGDDYVGLNDEEDDSYEDDYQIIPVTPELLEAVDSSYPDYHDATAWAAEYLDGSIVDEFDNIIDYGTLEQKAAAIDKLMSIYRQHN